MKLLRSPLVLAVSGVSLVCVLVSCGGSAPDTPEARGERSTQAVTGQTPDVDRAGSASVGVPQSLDIEAIGVTAPIIGVGTGDDGSQEVPASVHEVGWWEPGAEPGAAGNGVLVGHAYSRGQGVFDDLADLALGDVLTVTGSRGVADFVVERTRMVPVEEFAEVSDEIYVTTGEPRLVVMTCGDYDGDDYQATVIVSARLLASGP